jgi:hypothetical protein
LFETIGEFDIYFLVKRAIRKGVNSVELLQLKVPAGG